MASKKKSNKQPLSDYQVNLGNLLNNSDTKRINKAYSSLMNKFALGGDINGVESTNNFVGGNWNDFLKLRDQDIISSITPEATSPEAKPEVPNYGMYADIVAGIGTSAIDAFGKTEMDRISGSEVNQRTGKAALQWGSQGAKIGGMIAPGLGHLIGGAAGAIGGAVGGNINAKKAQKEQASVLKDMYYGNTFANGGPLNLGEDPTNPNADAKGRYLKDFTTHQVTDFDIVDYEGTSTKGDIKQQLDRRFKDTGRTDAEGNKITQRETFKNPRVTTDAELKNNVSVEFDGTIQDHEKMLKKLNRANFFGSHGFRGKGWDTGMTKEEKKEFKAENKLFEAGRTREVEYDLTGENPKRKTSYTNKDTVSFAMGGDITEINGPNHAQGGVQLTSNAEVEGGEAKSGDYIFSDRLKPEGGKKTFAEMAKAIKKKYVERPGDGPAMRTQEKEIAALKLANDAARAKQEQLEEAARQELGADASIFGEGISLAKGGKYKIDNGIKKDFLKIAKQRGLDPQALAGNIYAYGGKLNNKYPHGGPHDPPVDENGFVIDYTQVGGNQSANLQGQEALDMYNLIQSGQATPNLLDPIGDKKGQDIQKIPQREIEKIATNFQTPELKAANNIFESALAKSPEEQQQDMADKKFKMGNEELGLLLSNIPAVANLFNSQNVAKTNFARVNPEEVNLDRARLALERNAASARTTQAENVRGTATSSGQALSAMAAGNSAISDALGSGLLQSYIQEENANVGIRNQADQTNVGISNQETIANEQNSAMGKSLLNLALSDISSNSQAYLKDKKLTKENLKQNKRLMSVINSIAPNYKWEDDNGELAIKFQSALSEEPKTK